MVLTILMKPGPAQWVDLVTQVINQDKPLIGPNKQLTNENPMDLASVQ